MTPLSALQRALAAEHAALYVYGALGARTSASATPDLFGDLTSGYSVHRSRRDQLQTRVRDHDAEPVAAEAAYDIPEPLDTADQVVSAAREVERACTATYAWLSGQTSGEDRRWAIGALTDSAVRELTFRGSPEIFPGVGHTDR